MKVIDIVIEENKLNVDEVLEYLKKKSKKLKLNNNSNLNELN